MSLLRVGLAGCGRIALSVHLKIVLDLPGVELAALAEIDAVRRAKAHAVAPRAAVFSDFQEMLAMPELGAVIICLPNAFHAEAAIAAFANGKHAYIEKPLVTNLEEARRVKVAWQRSGMVGMIGFNYRFNPLYRALRNQVRSGRIGKPIAARSVFSTVPAGVAEWRDQRTQGGGVLLDLASHHVDLTRFMFDKEVVGVSSSLRSAHSEDDTAILQMHLSDDTFVQSFFSLSALEEDCFQVYGESGKLAVDRYRSFEVEYSLPTRGSALFAQVASSARLISRMPFLYEKLRSPLHEPSYRAALRHFFEAARTGQAVSPDLEDGYRSLAVVLAAEESATTGKLVSVSPGGDLM
jgi:predicted dehydrogenase